MGTVALRDWLDPRRECVDEPAPQSPTADEPSAFTGYRFPPEVIMLAVRWYLRYGLSYRDVEELLTERGIEVDTSPSTDGSNDSLPYSSALPDHVDTMLVDAGSSTKPTSKSPVSGATSTEPLMNTARS